MDLKSILNAGSLARTAKLTKEVLCLIKSCAWDHRSLPERDFDFSALLSLSSKQKVARPVQLLS